MTNKSKIILFLFLTLILTSYLVEAFDFTAFQVNVLKDILDSVRSLFGFGLPETPSCPIDKFLIRRQVLTNEIARNNNKVNFDSDPNDVGCCPTSNSCVLGEQCTNNKGIRSRVDRFDIKVFCEENMWKDCDYEESVCRDCFSDQNRWIYGGERSSVGEYDYQDLVGGYKHTSLECCGDDANEYVIDKDCNGQYVFDASGNKVTLCCDSGNKRIKSISHFININYECTICSSTTTTPTRTTTSTTTTQPPITTTTCARIDLTFYKNNEKLEGKIIINKNEVFIINASSNYGYVHVGIFGKKVESNQETRLPGLEEQSFRVIDHHGRYEWKWTVKAIDSGTYKVKFKGKTCPDINNEYCACYSEEKEYEIKDSTPTNPSSQQTTPTNPSSQQTTPTNPSSQQTTPTNPSSQQTTPTNPSSQQTTP
ncbi:MAG: hypothetical protein QXZ43_00005, partial [Candidatus Aenigmatarchaeota archaeon]